MRWPPYEHAEQPRVGLLVLLRKRRVQLQLAGTDRAWRAIDCDVCGATFGNPCRVACWVPGCASTWCALLQLRMDQGEAFCGGGRRARLHGGELPDLERAQRAIEREAEAEAMAARVDEYRRKHAWRYRRSRHW